MKSVNHHGLIVTIISGIVYAPVWTAGADFCPRKQSTCPHQVPGQCIGR